MHPRIYWQNLRQPRYISSQACRNPERATLILRRPFHVSRRSYSRLPPRRVRYAASSLVTATVAVGLVVSGQRLGYHGYNGCVRCDSDRSWSNWASSIPVVGSKSYQTDASSKQDGPEREDNGNQPPPPQTPVESDDKSDDSTAADASSWNVSVNSIGGKISDMLLPEWAKLLPAFLTKLQNELSAAPGSLAEQIWYEAHDPEINPEIIWDASVRISNDLCHDEKEFLKQRGPHTRKALATYLGLKEEDVHPDDVPTIAMCGSGGGLRALVAGAASYSAARSHGLFDCVTYTAGVSGSCWMLALYYSSLANQSHEKLIKHLKNRLGVHIAFPAPALTMLNSAPTNKYLLSGVVEKYRGVLDADWGLTDLYGLLLAARLFVPKGELSVEDADLKLSNQRRFTDDGTNPLPIYTAVRHEIPIEQQIESTPEQVARKAASEAWFQWFEFTPYEFWCEEFEAGIPSWALGRRFENGKTVWRDNGLALPEIRLPLLIGIWGSAFCATLSHYYQEVRPIMRSIAGFGGLDSMIAERNSDLVKVHPIEPATVPNFAQGLENFLPPSCPQSIFEASQLKLMDAGMSNNLPIYPLLRPGRNVDILIAFDQSADSRTDNWLKVADGYARQRGIKGWPVGIGWPHSDESVEQVTQELEAASADTEKEATAKLERAKKAQEAQEHQKKKKASKDLSYCNVWVGTTEERSSKDEPPPSKLIEEDWELMEPNAGITVVYFPLLPNPKVEGVDPKITDYMSTWNFVYTPEQIDTVCALAKANFEEGQAQTKRAVRAVYERKKRQRLEREQAEKDRKRRWKVRMGLSGKKLGEGGHGDQFS